MYDKLPETLQNVIDFNHQYLSHFFFITLIFAVSVFYVFYYKKNIEKPTNLFSVAIARFVFSTICHVSIYLIPFTTFIINPSITENAFVNVYTIFYTLYLTLLVFVFFADVFRYLPTMIMKMAGVDVDDPDVNKMYKSFEKEMDKIPFIRNIRK